MGCPQPSSPSESGFEHLSDADLIEQQAIEEARESFHAFRCYIHPKLKRSWFQRDAEEELQRFEADMVAGRRPELILEAPPQHGKSTIVIDFCAWIAGKNPDLKTIYASFSDRLGVRANLALQRIYASERYQRVFPETRIAAAKTDTPDGVAVQKTQDIIEYVGRGGSFRNTTVRGPITGEGLDLGILDDAIKGREAANSQTVRDSTWEWLTNDFFTRFSEHAGMIVIATRWHVDDPIGRLRAEDGDQDDDDDDSGRTLRVRTWKAIATEDEEHRKAGDPLFPDHKSLAFLVKRKKRLASFYW